MSCAFTDQPESIGAVNFAIDSRYGTWLFAGPPSELPTPPDYPSSEAYYHCDDWEEWLRETPGIYALAPGGLLSLVSGATDQIAVTNVQAQVFTRDPIPVEDFTLIQCNYQADADVGLTITTDTRTRATTLRDNYDLSSGEGSPMPPATAELNGIDSQVAAVVVNSDSYLYHGTIAADYAINGEQGSVALGNAESPYRWVGGDTSELVNATEAWDWDPIEGAWSSDVDLESIYPR